VRRQWVFGNLGPSGARLLDWSHRAIRTARGSEDSGRIAGRDHDTDVCQVRPDRLDL